MATTAKTKGKPKPKAKPKGKPAPMPSKKKTSPKVTKKVVKKTDESIKLPDNAVIDLTAYDWGEEKLTDIQKYFIVWFTTPGTKCYHRVMTAALKAGYAYKTAQATAYKFRNDPRIDRLIRQFDEKIGRVNIVDTVQRWIQEKTIRGDYDVKDYYETVDQENTRTGETRRVLRLKDIGELTPEQRLCIDGIDVKGMQGTMIYSLPEREKIRDSLINIMQKSQGGDSDDYDIETVAEIIKGNIQVKMKVITKNREIMARADGFVDAPRRIIEEE